MEKSLQQAVLGEMEAHLQISETRSHPPPGMKINSIWLTDVNVRQDTIKLLEENADKRFSAVNLTNIFSGQSPKTTEIKTQINQ